MKNLLSIATSIACTLAILPLSAQKHGATFALHQGPESIERFSEIDSLSYAIGVDMALNSGIRAVADGSLDVDVLTGAFRDAWNDRPLMSQEEATAFLSEYFTVRLPVRQVAESAAWLERVKAENHNIRTTPSGLMYEIIEAGDPYVRAIVDTDEVTVNYALSLKDGNVVDQIDNITFPLNRVIPCWTEGLKLIGKGGRITLWSPAELAYGARASGPIPANAALKFEIELLDVISAPAE